MVPNFTTVAPVKDVPVMTTLSPTMPLVGLKLVILGSTRKLVALVAVPATLVTVILPVVAPAGTLVVMEVVETTLNVALVLLKLTSVMPVKFVPVMVTATPIAPLAGVNEVIVGSLMTVNAVALMA